MFASKFDPDFGGQSPHGEALAALVREGAPILDLCVSNPTAVGLAYPPEIPALLAKPSALGYRPSPQGDPEARRAIGAYYRERGRTINPDDLFLTASTSEAYAFLFKLLCDPGDEVLIPSPGYPLFDVLAELENVNLVRYPLRMFTDDAAAPLAANPTAPCWAPDMDFLRASISTRCKALILVNPNNPTGHLADAEEIENFLRLAADFGLALIVDEVFSDYLLGSSPFLPARSSGPLIFTLNGFSKLLGLPQVKLGWVHVEGEPTAVVRAKERLEWISDAFLSVNTPVQAACGDLLSLRPIVQTLILDRLRINLAQAESMAGPRFRLYRPDAGWSLILDLDLTEGDEAFALRLLKEYHVNFHAGHLFGFEDGCRAVVSLLTPPDIFTEGLERIRTAVESSVKKTG